MQFWQWPRGALSFGGVLRASSGNVFRYEIRPGDGHIVVRLADGEVTS